MCRRKRDFCLNISFFSSSEIIARSDERKTEKLQARKKEREEYLKKISQMEPLLLTGDERPVAEVSRRLSWQYPQLWATKQYAKVSVSELPKLRAAGLTENDDELAPHKIWRQSPPVYFNRRPRFLKTEELTGAEKGTAYHTVMQHLELIPPLNMKAIEQQLQKMLSEGYLNPKEYNAIDPALIACFFATSLGKRIIRAYPSDLWRELPFTLALPTDELFCSEEETGLSGTKGARVSHKDPVLIQGVIDCLFKENDGFVLIDYKTGDLSGHKADELKQRYLRQLHYYSLAIERIWRGTVREKYLYFFDEGQLLVLR